MKNVAQNVAAGGNCMRYGVGYLQKVRWGKYKTSKGLPIMVLSL